VRPKYDQKFPLACVSAGQGLKGGEPACTPETVAGVSLTSDFHQKPLLTREKIYL
jgi:hypothetical protein